MIRAYHPLDIPYLYNICLKTAFSGKDASGLIEPEWLPAQFFLAPYLFFEPDCTLVLEIHGVAKGYITGTTDSKRFQKFCEMDWMPKLQSLTPKPADDDSSFQALIQRIIHNGYLFKPEFEHYPAHLHIDILPEAQGGGNGKALMDAFVDMLKSKQVKGLHLEVGKRNEKAIAFYKHYGFKEIAEFPFSIGFGMNM